MDKVLPLLLNKILKKSVYRAVCVCLTMLFCVQYTRAQSLGDPIVHITFGSGVSTYGPALAADSGRTDYEYSGKISPEDGLYGIYNTTQGLNPGWVLTRDHTGDPNGYMMVVNANFDPGIFYTRRVDGLCGSTMYQFGAWIKNILKPGSNGKLPNVSFTIEALDGTPLGAFDTNYILEGDIWIQYTGIFKTPASAQSVIVKMTNNAAGGGGNDIAIDDITFRPYGTTLSVQFNEVNSTFCAGAPKAVHMQALTPLDDNYAQRLQRYDIVSHTWVDQGPATTQSDVSFVTPNVAGSYSYRLIKGDAGNIDVSKCVVASNVLNLTVTPPPSVSFDAILSDCEGNVTEFTDRTLVQGLTITGWHWDFDDGQTSAEENPKHRFATTGNHHVTLSVTTDLGCGGDATKDVYIVPAMKPDFDNAIADCAAKSILFTDKSVIPEGNVTDRKWDFGDGTPPVSMSAAPFQHTFATAGPYNITLTLTNDRGCTNTITKAINVYNAPQVDFTLPEVCVNDAIAQFINTTTVDHNTTLSYLWNFGDDNATAANPNTSTEISPEHTYSQAKQYPITLKVTTTEGCEIILNKTFTVNGANPKPAFTILNSAALCSNREVDFANNSTVDIGNVTRLKWDYGDGSLAETDENPTPGKLYHHKYATFGTPGTKPLTVTLIAYSGASEASCAGVVSHPITLLAAPQLTFNAPDSVCLNFGAVQFAAQETGGIAGAGVYSGTGVTASGLFDPQKTGVGTFDITYTYTVPSGCAEIITHKIKVNPLTKVDAGPDVSIPDDETTILHPTTTPSDSLTYLWTPATGLSSDTVANPVVKIDHDMTYTLTVTNKYGCAVTDQVKVVILHGVVVPNAFTPNADGINDTWVIKDLPAYTGCTVDVFNRNGQKVYTSVGYSATGWDGKFRGADLPVGVYYYIINPKHGRKVVSGFVTIIR